MPTAISGTLRIWALLLALAVLTWPGRDAAAQPEGSISLTAFACPPGMTATTLTPDACEVITEGFGIQITSLEGVFTPLGLADAAFDGTSYSWALGPAVAPLGAKWGLRATALPEGHVDYVLQGRRVVSPIGDGPYVVSLTDEEPNAAVSLYAFTASDPEPPGATGRWAQVVAGSCDGARSPVAGSIQLLAPVGDPLGLPTALIAETGLGTVPIALDALFAEPHAVLVIAETDAGQRVVACGDLGAVADDDGVAVIGLREVAGSGFAGIAYLAANPDDPTGTDVSVFLAEGLAGDGPAADASARRLVRQGTRNPAAPAVVRWA